MPILEDKKEAVQRQTGRGLKILTPKQMITRFPILLGPIKSRKQQSKLKMK